MHPSDARAAVAAAMSLCAALGLTVEHAVVLRDSDKLMVRLLPCDVVARIAHEGREVCSLEVEFARRLAEARSPVIALDPRVAPHVHKADGFAITLWTYHEPVGPAQVPPAEYARALHELHVGMRTIDLTAPHFTDRVAGALSIVETAQGLPDADREILMDTLETVTEDIEARGAPEQLLHGEPHPGNVLRTSGGLVFIDLETCCRGPVEFDIAHTVELDDPHSELGDVAVAEHYPDANHELVRECVQLMLAMIIAWRWHPDDQLPDRLRLRREWIGKLREARARR